MLYLNDYRSIFVSLCFSKKMLMEKNGNSANEKWLYHGSISTVIKDICVQNLDWRLCGLNGVAYGQGSYFALNASYSHKYARSDSQDHRYMFLAQVLVGQFTTVSSMILFQVFLGL